MKTLISEVRCQVMFEVNEKEFSSSISKKKNDA
jgi:hypothetical protein